MKTLHVEASCPYDIEIEAGLLGKAGEKILPFCKNRFAAIVTDSTVDALYAPALEESLAAAGIRTVKFVFPAGEASKNAATYISILEFLAKEEVTRSDLLIALGGGVVGDVTGFAAATFLRGIDFVQIPTTLLAMVDSSVGGKTAIDLENGKNLAGAFHQPKLVLCDPDLLSSLPPAIFASGCGEVLKYGVLESEPLFRALSVLGTGFDREDVIFRCLSIKSRIVKADEWDRGTRQLLNLGHTFGHAMELESGFSLSHGSAVAIGMVMAAKCAAKEGLCDPSLSEVLRLGVEKCGLPSSFPIGAETLFSAMCNDKKRSGDTITLILPEKIGRCIPYPISKSALLPFLTKGLQ